MIMVSFMFTVSVVKLELTHSVNFAMLPKKYIVGIKCAICCQKLYKFTLLNYNTSAIYCTNYEVVKIQS